MIVVSALVVGLMPASGAAVPEFIQETFKLDARGEIVSRSLPPGAYAVTVSGTYNYDNTPLPGQFADAECSTDSEFWDDPVDLVDDTVDEVSPSEWHRHRYVVGGPEKKGDEPSAPLFNDPDPAEPKRSLRLADELDVGIGMTPEPGSGLEQIPPATVIEWEPLFPTPENDAGEPGLGCDEETHTYATEIVVPPGAATLDFQIVDKNTPDNEGNLDVGITGVGG